MTRRILAGVAAMVVAAGATAAAQTKKDAPPPATGGAGKAIKEKFYNFDDLLIDGEYKKPNALLFTARDKVKFERLLKLRKSFIPVILTSDKERALR